MREYLFHGKRLDNGEWVEGFLVENEDDVYRAFIVSSARWEVDADGDTDLMETQVFEVDPETVGQFTGLTDQKGTRAFTDSVIKYSGEYGHVVYGVVRFGEIPPVVGVNADHIGFYIEWQNDGANMWNEWWRNDLKYWLAESLCEIIGNRWDNPELLEGV